MKKKIVLSVMLLVMVIVACVALYSCNLEKAFLKFHYTITTQYTRSYDYTTGDLIYKPENPTFINGIFTDGGGKTSNGTVSSELFSIEYPRLEEGYSYEKNYYFVGWFTEPEFRYQWNFAEDRIYRDMTLYAKWLEI